MFQPMSILNHKFVEYNACGVALIVFKVIGVDLSPIQPELYDPLLTRKSPTDVYQCASELLIRD